MPDSVFPKSQARAHGGVRTSYKNTIDERSMSRASEAALKAYPDKELNGCILIFDEQRYLYQKGYEQAEKDTIERAIDWLERNYPYYYEVKNEIGMTMGEEFRKAMEGE
jgi:hypothetical protein